MKENEIKKYIDKKVKEELSTIDEAVEAFRDKKLETLLRKYIKYLGLIENINNKINYITSGSYVVSNSNSDGEKVQTSHKFKDHVEKLEDTLNLYEQKRAKLIYITTEIKIALEIIKVEEYYQIIPLTYFDKLKVEQITGTLGISRSTYFERKNELLSEIKSVMFI